MLVTHAILSNMMPHGSRPTHIQGHTWSPSNHGPIIHILPQQPLSKRSQFPSHASATRLHDGFMLHRSAINHKWLPVDTYQHQIAPEGISVSSHLYTINSLLYIVIAPL
ncbi:hypothetical protein HN51_037278 [Arachis hypogaea]